MQAECSRVLALETLPGCKPSITPVSPSKLPVSPTSYLDFSGCKSVSSQGCQDPVYVPDWAVYLIMPEISQSSQNIQYKQIIPANAS